MAKFLDTQGVSYFLKQLINHSEDKLYLIIQLNNQLKLSLEDRHKFQIDIVIIYGKVSDINPEDSNWLGDMPGIKLLFHKDLHAKCYFNENEAIVTSMNLYMFSQQNNVEMGIHITKEEDPELYKSIAHEVDRIKRSSEHRTISVQKVDSTKSIPNNKPSKMKPNQSKDYSKSKFISTSAMSKLLDIQSGELFEFFEDFGWIKRDGKSWELTNIGIKNGGQMKKGKYGDYVAWPEEIADFIDKEMG